MTEHKLYQAQKGWLRSAVESLRAAGAEVIAPTETEPGVVNLAPVTSAEEIITQDGNVELPLKRLFFPITEVLLKYEKKEGGDVDVEPEPLPPADEVVVMGCRPCDADALEAMDKVFQWDYDDLRYRVRRERTTLISFACMKPDTECFCTSVGGSPYSSRQSDALVFLKDDGSALIQVHTPKGMKFIEHLGAMAQLAGTNSLLPSLPDLPKKFDPKKVKAWLDENFESEFWANQSLACLGCGACTYLCPTCHCFDIVDEATWNRGERRRNWDSCAFSLFTLHASGHNPRPTQSARYRQRLMHKFKYFPERFGLVACVGCGRCIKACGAGLNVVSSLVEVESK